jgi:hypothetical protein
MNLKKDEFRTLKQGDRTLKEYMDDFCSLSRYAPEDIDTDAKRKDKFLCGLKGELKIPLSVAYTPNYQALLDQAVTLDNNIRKEEICKRKHSNGKTHTEYFHKRPHFSEGYGNGNFNGHRHNGGNNGNHSNDHHNGEMEILMEEMDNTTPNLWLRRISRPSLVISANKRDTMRINV